MQRVVHLLLAVTTASLALAASTPKPNGMTGTTTKNDKTVLILGGGVAGIIAARTLAEKKITDFLIIEGRDELGGRMRSMQFGAEEKRATIELGANWIQGTQEGDGPANPILTLAREHGVKTAESDFYGSVGAFCFVIHTSRNVNFLPIT
jgi:polyamine oxidase